MPKIEAARAFGVGIPSVKCYVATYRGGRRSPASRKRPGSEPELPDEDARKLLEADLEERPTTARFRRGASSCGELARVGERLHGFRGPGAPRMDPKKDRRVRPNGASG